MYKKDKQTNGQVKRQTKKRVAYRQTTNDDNDELWQFHPKRRSRLRYVHVYVDIHVLVHFHCDDGVMLIKAQIFVCIVFVPFARLFGFRPSSSLFLLSFRLGCVLPRTQHVARAPTETSFSYSPQL